MNLTISYSVDHPPAVNDRLEAVEARLIKEPQVNVPLTERFAPGVYLREVFMPAGTIVLGHEHKTEHFNIVLTGRATVMIDGEVHEICAPCTFVSKPGVRKALYIHEDMIWQTVHPTDETDPVKLESDLITKSRTFLENQEELKQLTCIVKAIGEDK